jgi:type IV pilus assembly protein PilF
MKNIIKFWVLIFLLILLTACSTVCTNNINPEAASINTQLGLNYLQEGDIVSAKSKLLLALQEDPDNPMVLDAMGYFWERTGDLDSAEEYYLRAIKLAPNKGEVQNNYGTYLCRHRHYHESIKHFLLAAQDINYLHVAAAYENAGLCALKIPDKKLARKYLELAVKHDPARVLAQHELAKLDSVYYNVP